MVLISKDRTLQAEGDFDSAMRTELCEKIFNFNLTDKTDPILVEINSPGGDISVFENILNFYNSSSFKMNTLVANSGIAASCGARLFMLGEERIMFSSSKLIFHAPSRVFEKESSYNYFELQDALDDLEDDFNYTLNMIIENTSLSRKSIIKKIQKEGDWIVCANEALELGLATKVISTFDEYLSLFE